MALGANSPDGSDRPSVGLGTLGGLALGLAGLLYFAAYIAGTFDNPPLNDPMIRMFGGVVILLVLLQCLGFVTGALGISNREEAFGMPSGSMRAVMAIGLVVIFGMFGFHHYTQLIKGQLQDDVVELRWADVEGAATPPAPPAAVIQRRKADLEGRGLIVKRTEETSNATKFLVLKPSPGTEYVGFGRDMFTVLSTLVASVVSFYFASKSIEAGMAAALGKKPTSTAEVERAGPSTAPRDVQVKSTKISFEGPSTLKDPARQLGALKPGSAFDVSGSRKGNDGRYTVKEALPDRLLVNETTWTTEEPGQEITIKREA